MKKTKKQKTRPLSYTTHKNNSKWVNDLNIRPDTITSLKENIRMKLLGTGLENDVFLYDIKITTKGKNHKWDYNKLKSFCTAKEIINKMKMWSTEWKKNFVTTYWMRG